VEWLSPQLPLLHEKSDVGQSYSAGCHSLAPSLTTILHRAQGRHVEATSVLLLPCMQLLRF